MTNNLCWKGYREQANTIHCWWSCIFVQTFWKSIQQEIQKITNVEIPHLPETYLLGLLSDVTLLKSITKTFQLLLAILHLTIATAWKQPVI